MDWTVIKHLYKRTKTQHKKIILTTILFALGLILVQFKPVILQQLIDSAIAGEHITKYLWYIGGILIITNIVFRFFDYLLMKTQVTVQKITYDYSLTKLIEHSYSFFTNNFSGGLVAKSKRYANSFEPIQDIFLFNLFSAIVSVVTITIILLFKNTLLSAIFFAWAIIYAIVSVKLTTKQKQFSETRAQEDSKTTALLSDIITNILTIKMFAKEKKEIKTYEKQTTKNKEAIWQEWRYMLIVFLAQATLLGVLEFAILFISVKGYQAGTISIGTIALVQLYAVLIFNSVWNFGRGVQKITTKLSEMKEMIDIIELEPEVQDHNKRNHTIIKKGAITIKDLTFSYDKKPVLENFNLNIKAGEKIGLVGISGSGKTTITKLLLRFFDIQKGIITIDGHNISKLTQQDLRQAIAYVPQDPSLFHRTIKENISYAKKSTQKEINDAMKKARVDKFVEKLPHKELTLVGERGIKLSGGERQRVAIARAIIKKAPIVVMDEATSSLDTVSERHIQESIHELLKEKTAIIIAHRLSTVKELDRIIVLDKGRIVEQGTHNALLQQKGAYYKLYQNQQL